jgi:hypothetical protein
LLIAGLLGFAVGYQPIATKADEKGDANTAGVVMRGSDPGLRGPSSGGPLVLQGTRPVTPAAAESPNERNRPPPYMGFVPAPYFGSGWNTQYDWGGLSYTPYPQQAQ